MRSGKAGSNRFEGEKKGYSKMESARKQGRNKRKKTSKKSAESRLIYGKERRQQQYAYKNKGSGGTYKRICRNNCQLMASSYQRNRVGREGGLGGEPKQTGVTRRRPNTTRRKNTSDRENTIPIPTKTERVRHKQKTADRKGNRQEPQEQAKRLEKLNGGQFPGGTILKKTNAPPGRFTRGGKIGKQNQEKSKSESSKIDKTVAKTAGKKKEG